MIKGVYHILTNDTTVYGLVGDNIHPVVLPQDSRFPAIAISTDTDRPEQSKRAANTQSTRLHILALQVEIYVDSYASGEAISNACKNALDNYAGTANTEVFQRIEFEDQSSTPLIEPEILVFSQRYEVRELK